MVKVKKEKVHSQSFFAVLGTTVPRTAVLAHIFGTSKQNSKHMIQSLGFHGDILPFRSVDLNYLKRSFSQTIMVKYSQEQSFPLFLDLVMHS